LEWNRTESLHRNDRWPIERCQSSADPDRKLDLKLKIAELTRRILEAKRIWERYAPWDS
jgi:hypothetical protein